MKSDERGISPLVVYCPREMGGVRHVTEALSDGIEQNGRAVIRAHSLADLMRARWSGASTAILSLEAGFLAGLYRKSVYILHGFPVVDSYSLARRVAVRAAARLARRGGARLVAVSHLTRAVHERLYGISVDAVIFNGCSGSLHRRAAEPRNGSTRHKWITYVGRLIEGKGVKVIVAGFATSTLPSLGYELRIAGGGPLAEWVSEASRRCASIRMLGEISEQAKEDLLFSSEAFVSLNDFEPMGVVFVEAALAGCKIVAPFCGGHREFIPLEHAVSLCDPSSVVSVAAAFDRLPSLRSMSAPWTSAAFSYPDHVAREYLAVLGDARPPEMSRDAGGATNGGRAEQDAAA
jgi:glycosyltransferase involved in cell wall biosynthesis